MTDPMKDEGGSPECVDPPGWEYEREQSVRFACGCEIAVSVYGDDGIPTDSTEPCWLCAPCEHCGQPVRACPCFTDPFADEEQP